MKATMFCYWVFCRLSCFLSYAAYAQVVDRPLFAFGDVNTGPNVTATQIGNVTTITSINTPVPIEFANGNPFAGEGIYNLTATSVGAVTPLFTPGEFAQDYTGSFSVTGNDGFNYLSATFSEPLLGIDASANVINENQLQFSHFGAKAISTSLLMSVVLRLASTRMISLSTSWASSTLATLGSPMGRFHHSQPMGLAISVHRDQLWQHRNRQLGL